LSLRCGERLLPHLVAEVQPVRPAMAAILEYEHAAVSQNHAQLVERRTWAESVRQVQSIAAEATAQGATANQQWMTDW
ncbi:MAG: hypothetical protein FWD12_06240, partial [Alphaproteobacteria bacterium]|nr:hypothetical protein [Alphaproteobacteria bacterium]